MFQASPNTQDSMLDVIELGNEYYIRARSSLVDNQTRVLMQGDMFAVFDRRGDFQPLGFGEHGLFYNEARHLSKSVLRLSNGRLWLLSSTVGQDNAVLTVDLTNPDLDFADGRHLLHGTIHFKRTKFLWKNACQEEILVRNFGLVPTSFELMLEFDADFADIFEVRGYPRAKRRVLLKPDVDDSSVTLSYQGLDEVLRKTTIASSLKPIVVTSSEMRFRLDLESQEEKAFSITVSCSWNDERPLLSYHEATKALASQVPKSQGCGIETSNEQFNDWINRSRADLQMMITATPEGLYPYAGVPWFSTVFGRDGIITAFEYLWIDPEIAKGVLRYLAATQATEHNIDQDAEPGKILHETRKSELAQIGEVPFGRYYGSADSTPLFVCLAAAYFERTGDQEFLQTIWPNIETALDWIDRFGDRDGDGFVEYGRQSQKGLIQQGWKDSYDSIFHANGQLAEGPIALCEIQTYVFAAKRGIASAATALGHLEKAQALQREAESLREQFEDAFWCDEISLYALALDKDKHQCRVRSSNAGHCLFTGIADQERARRMIEEFRSERFFSGWGVRTIAG